MKTTKWIILFFTLFISISSCRAEDPKEETYARNSPLQAEFIRSTFFWNQNGHDLQPSDNPEITTSFSISMPEGWVAFNRGSTIFYGDVFLNYDIEDREKIIAHEIGHILDYSHTRSCGKIMSSTVGCLRWNL